MMSDYHYDYGGVDPDDLPYRSSFPQDLFTMEQRRNGAIVLYFIGLVFVIVAEVVLCNKYFISAMDVATRKLGLKWDVSGATLFAIVISFPALVTTLVGAALNTTDFHSGSLGSIVGAVVFNAVFAVGVGALLAGQVLSLTKWPLLRDLAFFLLPFIFMVLITLDDRIEIWEPVPLLIWYLIYLVFMKFEGRVARALKMRPSPENDLNVVQTLPLGQMNTDEKGVVEIDPDPVDHEDPVELRIPKEKGACAVVGHVLSLPFLIPYYFTMPDVRKPKWRNFFWLTILVSLLWILLFSYLTVWWLTTIGETLSIPTNLMGMLFLIPVDLIVRVLLARRGRGDAVISMSLGMNIFHLTVGLPLPWLLYKLVNGNSPELWYSSDGTVCSGVLTLGCLIVLVVFIAIFRFRLRKLVGFLLVLVYLVFVAVAMGFEYDLYACPL